VIAWKLILIAVAAPAAADSFSLGPTIVDNVAFVSIGPGWLDGCYRTTGAFRVGGPCGALKLPPVEGVASTAPR